MSLTLLTEMDGGWEAEIAMFPSYSNPQVYFYLIQIE